MISDSDQKAGDFSAKLLEQRVEYIKLRDRAAQIAASCSNGDIDIAMAEQRMFLGSAIASIDDALKAYRSTRLVVRDVGRNAPGLSRTIGG
jgi:hypothetical protein